MSNLISRTARVNLEEWDEGMRISGLIYDSENMSQYVRDALRAKNERELIKIKKKAKNK
jgi:hypothetical protein